MHFYLKMGADLGNGVQELLFSALAKKDLEAIKWSVAHGADVHAMKKTTGAAVSPFHAADENFREDISAFLLASGVDVDVRTSLGETALMLAARKGDSKRAGFYLAQGADPLAQAYSGNTALDEAQKYLDGARDNYGYRDSSRDASGRAVVQLLLQEIKRRHAAELSDAAIKEDIPLPRPIMDKNRKDPGI
jgi:ankyrin repeat protein